jgi:hypothetical protein
LGSEIRGSEKPIPDPDPRVKKAPDPGSATLEKFVITEKKIHTEVLAINTDTFSYHF